MSVECYVIADRGLATRVMGWCHEEHLEWHDRYTTNMMQHDMAFTACFKFTIMLSVIANLGARDI